VPLDPALKGGAYGALAGKSAGKEVKKQKSLAFESPEARLFCSNE